MSKICKSCQYYDKSADLCLLDIHTILPTKYCDSYVPEESSYWGCLMSALIFIVLTIIVLLA